MSWENCVQNIKNCYKPSPVKEVGEVDWSSVKPQDLENNTLPFFLICPGRHCIDYVNTTPADHALCQCKDINGNPIPGCTPPSALYPEKASVCLDVTNPNVNFNSKSGKACFKQGDNWYELTCYCCCSCFANGTRIGVPAGFKAIEQFHIGDQVLAGSIEADGAGIRMSWQTAKVTFSSGTGPDSHQPVMIFIRHGEVGSIIVTPDHLFLLPSGKLKRADRLVPGIDQLVSAEGQPVAIHEVSVGEYTGGVHHIATNREFTGDLNGHLLVSEGIVSGDFNLQIHASQLKENHFVDDHDDLPKIGTPQYEALNTHLAGGLYSRFMSTTAGAESRVNALPKKFYVYGAGNPGIPEGAAAYLSPSQQDDVALNADTLSFTEVGIGAAMVQYALKLFQGFYPEIAFYHDAGRLEPNAYAFQQYGKSFVVITGGLTRIKELGLEGISLILSHMVSRLQKSEPVDRYGYTTVGMADYYSPNILRNVYFGTTYDSAIGAGIRQVMDCLFSKIDEAHDAYEDDPYKPTRETRMEAIKAGDTMHYPPEGIGGPVEGGLQVTGATALPPTVTADSFVTADITEAASAQVYAELQKLGLLGENGELSGQIDLDTDLSFLFADQADNLKRLLIEEVRYVLLHTTGSVKVAFNIPVHKGSASAADDYTLEPEATVTSAVVQPDGLAVTVGVKLAKGETYTLTVASYVKAANGSTLDPDNNSAKAALI